MKIWKKVVFGALAGLGVTLAAHAYGPGNPASLTAVPQGFAECAVDGGVCKVPPGATAYVVYGINGKYLTSQGTGDFTCLPKGWVPNPTPAKPQDLGIPDPVPNVQKKCYLQVAAAITPPAQPAPPAAAGFSGKGPAGCTDKRCWLEAVDKAQNACKASGCSTCTPNTTASDNCKFENGYTCTSFCKAATPPAATPPVAAPQPPAAPQGKMACYWMESKAPWLWVPSPMPAPTQADCKRLDSCSPDGGKASGGGCYVWATEEQVKGENAKKTAAPPPTIKVQHAEYGQNCAGKGKPDPNIKGTDPTKHIAAACDGKGSCDYKVDHTAIGDPVFGCRKEYTVQYHCGTGQPKKATVAPEASGQMAKLDCTK